MTVLYYVVLLMCQVGLIICQKYLYFWIISTWLKQWKLKYHIRAVILFSPKCQFMFSFFLIIQVHITNCTVVIFQASFLSNFCNINIFIFDYYEISTEKLLGSLKQPIIFQLYLVLEPRHLRSLNLAYQNIISIVFISSDPAMTSIGNC